MYKNSLFRFFRCLLPMLLTTATLSAQPHCKVVDYTQLNDQVMQVSRIVRDVQGMMWFATNNGLYRYDGYEFRNFKSHSGDGINMSSNHISYMYASSTGSIWCVASRRLYLFDTQSYRYVDVLADYERPTGHRLEIRKIRPMPNGITWIFTSDGQMLTLVDAHPTTTVRLMADGEDFDNVTVVNDTRQHSWVLTDNHAYRYADGLLQRFDGTYRQIIIGQNSTWLITADGLSVQEYDERGQRLRPWTHPSLTSAITGYTTLANGTLALHTRTGLLLLSADGQQVTTTAVTDAVEKVMEDGNGHLWIHVEDGRLLMSADATCRAVTEIPGFRAQKCNLMRDEAGCAWIFTDAGDAYYAQADDPTCVTRFVRDDMRGGIQNTIDDGQGGYWFIRNHKAYRLSFRSPLRKPWPLHQAEQVRCIARDSLQRILVATRYDETVTLFSADGQRLGWLSRDGRISTRHVPFGASVYCSWCSTDGTLWLGTKRDGVFRCKPSADGTFRIDQYARQEHQTEKGIGDNEIYDLVPDRYGRLWIATRRGGLCCIVDYMADAPQFVSAEQGLEGWQISPEVGVTSLLVTPDDQLIVGTQDGLLVADVSCRETSTIAFRTHRCEADRAESLSSSNITDVLRTRDGSIFIATDDGGLNRLEGDNPLADELRFQHHNLSTGFPSDIILNMTECDGSLWMTAPNQLIELQLNNIGQPDVNTYLMHENPRFVACRPMQLSSKQWLFGSEDGTSAIDLDRLKTGAFVPPLVITGIVRGNGPVTYTTGWNDTLKLRPDERDLTVEFSALDFENTELVAYAYRLDDAHPWSYIGHNHSVTFSRMQPGAYRLSVRSTNRNGMWCDNEQTLAIVVQPTFRETPWFFVLMVLLTALAGSSITYTVLYIRRIKQQQRETMEAYLALLSEQPAALAEKKPATNAAGRTSADDELMNRLMKFIEEHLFETNVTIDDMASAVAMSHSTLNRKVRHLVGMSPIEFLHEARIRKAKLLLTESDKSVANIAYECGFSDPKYFSKSFKASTGQTPTEFKRTVLAK